jgi:two-component system sensor kinase FixL
MKIFTLFEKHTLPFPGGAYTLGAVLVGLTLALREFLLPGFQIPILVIFVPAILVTATLGGFRAGLLSAVVACAGADYFLISPFFAWTLPSGNAAMDLASLAVTGLVVSAVCAVLRKAIQQSEAAKSELEKSEEKFRSLIDQASDALFLYDENGRILEVNRQTCESLGYSREELLQKSIFDIEKSVDPVAVKRAWSEAEPGNSRTLEGCHRRKDGTEFPVEARLGAYHFAGQKVQLALVRDISERKRAEDVLRTQANLLKQSFDAIILWQFDGVIETWNEGAEKLYGYSEREAVGCVTHDLLATIFPKPWAEIRAELIEKGTWEGEMRHHTRNGQVVIVSARKQLVRGADGVARVLETNRDITERKQSEQHLRTMRDELAHVGRLSELGQVSAGIAHELNQPLTAMMNYSNVARRLIESKDAANMEKAGEAIAKATDQAQRAGTIIRRMRNFIEKRETHRASEDINSIVDDAVALALIGAKADGITTDLRLEADLPPVFVDRLQIQQVLVNLIRNAVDAMAETPQRVLTLSTSRSSVDGVEVSVSDTGPGLPKEVADRIFMPFFTTKPGGMGIGLVISQSIVEAHGGQITVETKPGHGALFRFTVPVAVGTGAVQ